MSEPVRHTPGPWAYGLGYRVRPDRGVDAKGREIGGPTICEVNANADRCCPPSDEIEANGRLIAAAPELLAACKALPLDCEFEDAADFKDNARAFLRAMEFARSAIAKAEGSKAA